MAINVDRVPERDRARWLAALTRRLDFVSLPPDLAATINEMYDADYRVDIAANRLKVLLDTRADSTKDAQTATLLYKTTT